LIKVLTSILRIDICYIEPVLNIGYIIEHRLKGTLGITGWWILRVLIDEFVWHLDVDLSHPSGEQSTKGSAVRRLKWYMSWV